MKLKKLAAVVAAAGALGASGFAWASWMYTDVAYYSDATYTTQVGQQIIDCDHNIYTSGHVTSYRRMQDKYDCSAQ